MRAWLGFTTGLLFVGNIFCAPESGRLLGPGQRPEWLEEIPTSWQLKRLYPTRAGKVNRARHAAARAFAEERQLNIGDMQTLWTVVKHQDGEGFVSVLVERFSIDERYAHFYVGSKLGNCCFRFLSVYDVNSEDEECGCCCGSNSDSDYVED